MEIEISNWICGRHKLLDFLKTKINRIKSTHTWASRGRLMGSSMDSLFTVAGFLMDRYQQDNWADVAFIFSFSSGIICLAVTLMETMYHSGNEDELRQVIREDERNYKVLRSYLMLSRERECVCSDRDIYRWFQYMEDPVLTQESEEDDPEINPEELNVLGSAQRELKNFIREAIKHPIALDLVKMKLQVLSNPKHRIGIFSLSVRDLPEEQQRIASLPVSGRIILNSLTAFRSCCNLRGEFMPKQYKYFSSLENVERLKTDRAHKKLQKICDLSPNMPNGVL